MHGVVGQEPGRLGRVHGPLAPCREVADHRGESPFAPDEPPSAAPVHHVGVAVRLSDAGHRLCRGPGAVHRQAAESRNRQGRDQGRIDPVPRRNQHRNPPVSGKLAQLRPAPGQFVRNHAGRAMVPELGLLLPVRSVTAVRPSVLQHLRANRRDPWCQGRFRQGRDNRESHRDAMRACQVREAIEGRRRRHGIVVAPPQ